MNQKDQLKVMAAGFTIIRSDENALKIKQKTFQSPDWKTRSKGFSSKAELKREMEFLLKLSTIIED